jgi:hypothetical protein
VSKRVDAELHGGGRAVQGVAACDEMNLVRCSSIGHCCFDRLPAVVCCGISSGALSADHGHTGRSDPLEACMTAGHTPVVCCSCLQH